jgi:hypothetical protein
VPCGGSAGGRRQEALAAVARLTPAPYQRFAADAPPRPAPVSTGAGTGRAWHVLAPPADTARRLPPSPSRWRRRPAAQRRCYRICPRPARCDPGGNFDSDRTHDLQLEPRGGRRLSHWVASRSGLAASVNPLCHGAVRVKKRARRTVLVAGFACQCGGRSRGGGGGAPRGGRRTVAGGRRDRAPRVEAGRSGPDRTLNGRRSTRRIRTRERPGSDRRPPANAAESCASRHAG